MKQRSRGGVWQSLVAVVCSVSACTSPDTFEFPSPPPLPAPAGLVIRVASVQELYDALGDLRSNTTVVLQPGRYNVTEPLHLGGADSSAVLTTVALRGASDRPDDVIIEGGGVEIGSAGRVQIANLTFANSRRAAVHIRGESGATRPHIYNVRFADAAGPMIRVTQAKEGQDRGVVGGIVEYGVFEYTNVEATRESTGAIVVSGGVNWVIRYNLFRSIRAGLEARRSLRPAVMIRDESEGTETHNNLFVDCERAIVYGMGDADTPADHNGGAIYNNFIYRRRGFERGDAGIMLWGSPGTKVYHNTVIQNGTSKRPIEFRFASTTSVDIRNNLTDGPIEARDGARGLVAGNYMKATPRMFRNPRAGDLRLTSTATEAIDRGVQVADVPDDWDQQKRPVGSRPDIGADEHAPDPSRSGASLSQ